MVRCELCHPPFCDSGTQTSHSFYFVCIDCGGFGSGFSGFQSFSDAGGCTYGNRGGWHIVDEFFTKIQPGVDLGDGAFISWLSHFILDYWRHNMPLPWAGSKALTMAGFTSKRFYLGNNSLYVSRAVSIASR